MKRWAIITVGLYGLVLLLLTVPVGAVCFHWFDQSMTMSDIIGVFKEWGYWLYIAVAVIAQVLLLLVPVAVS